MIYEDLTRGMRKKKIRACFFTQPGVNEFHKGSAEKTMFQVVKKKSQCLA